MEYEYNIVELFSGIGSQAKALKNLDIKLKNTYTCEWDIHAFVAYDAIHNSPKMPNDVQKMNKVELLAALEGIGLSNNGKESMKFETLSKYGLEVLQRIYAAIRKCNNFVDVSTLTGDRIPENIDIMTYSFPCQDLSNVGAFHGYNKGIDKDSGSRSSLLWQVGRILREMNLGKKKLPRYLLLENVPALLAQRHIGNFNKWIQELEELGYVNKIFQLNAKWFGIPQNRPRLLMLSVYVGNDFELKKKVMDYLLPKHSNDIVDEYKASNYYKNISVDSLLRTNYDDEDLFEEAVACTPNDTASRREIWNENPQIILENGKLNPDIDVVRTITTKQDRNPNSGNLYFDCKIAGKSKFRYLTPRECFLFMGFTDDDYERVVNENPVFRKNNRFFSRDKLIRMAGNSIPVKLLEGIFLQIKKIDELVNIF